MRKELLVYNGPGVSKRFLPYLEKELNPFFNIRFINIEKLLNSDLLKNASTFLMPGGRDIYFYNDLKGLGNQLIKQFVSNGGNYIGICAGAYYGASYVEFAKGSKLEVLGERHLKFTNATASGPIIGVDFSYDDKTASRVEITYHSQNLLLKLDVYYHGGCYFKNVNDCDILAYYNSEKKLPAIVYKKYGRGKVILSGVHFEHPVDKENKDQKKRRRKVILDIVHTLNHSS